jgi:hypothetical protein
MKNLYYRLETVDQLAIPIAISLKLLCFVFQESENCLGGTGILESLGRGMYGEVYSCLLGIFGQGGSENGFKIGRGGHCGRHGKTG